MIKKNKLVCGIGINDYAGCVKIKGKHIKSYKTWGHILERCYSTRCQIKHPTYIGCSVCSEWLFFSNFKLWYDANYINGFDVDKDILIKGNKVYSPTTCIFVPRYLNSLLTDAANNRGKMPIGVSERKPNNKNRKVNSTYQASCNNGYGRLLTKTFKTVEEAQEWYAETKKRIVKEQVLRAFLEDGIKSNICTALLEREW